MGLYRPLELGAEGKTSWGCKTVTWWWWGLWLGQRQTVPKVLSDWLTCDFFFFPMVPNQSYIYFLNLEATLQYCIGFAVLNLERLGGWDKSFGLPNLVCTANKGVSDVSRLCLWKCFWMLIYKWHQECHWGGKGGSPHFLSCKTEIRISNMAYSWGWEDGIR